MLNFVVALKRADWVIVSVAEARLLGAGVLGDGFGALGHSVLGKLAWQEQPDSSLYLPGGDGVPLVVVGEPASLTSNPLEQIIHKRVHDAHGLRGHSSIRMDLLQNLVDVGRVRFSTALLLRLDTRDPSSLLDDSFGCNRLGWCSSWSVLLGWHSRDQMFTVGEYLLD